jgi:hypothetical protein
MESFSARVTASRTLISVGVSPINNICSHDNHGLINGEGVWNFGFYLHANERDPFHNHAMGNKPLILLLFMVMNDEKEGKNHFAMTSFVTAPAAPYPQQRANLCAIRHLH